MTYVRLHGNKSVPKPSSFQTGPLERYFSSTGERIVCHKSGLENFLLLSGAVPNNKTLHSYKKIGQKVFQTQGTCFDLSNLLHLRMQVMQLLLKKWSIQWLMVFVYVDVILSLAKSKSLATQDTYILLQDVRESGLIINLNKSNTTPSQKVDHLGFFSGLGKALLQIPSYKMKAVRKYLSL